jgi:ABC-type multidrug transport system ATPase subunit
VAADEARRGTTLIGPQRDDLCFLINGLDARVYGSQGQQRTAALALKLAEFQLIDDYVGEPPVMLLDDVMSDLDDARRSHLLAWVRRRCQTFLTCTNLRSFPREILDEAAIYSVEAGTVVLDGKPQGRCARDSAEPAPTGSSRQQPASSVNSGVHGLHDPAQSGEQAADGAGAPVGEAFGQA